MTLAQQIQDVAGEIAMAAPYAHERLCEIALEVARLERFADERVADAQDVARARAGLRPIGEIIAPIVEMVGSIERL